MRPPAAWVDRLASPLAFYPPFPASYTIKRQPDGRRELYVAPTRESRLPSCAFAEAALLQRQGPRDGGKKQVAAALIPAPPATTLASDNNDKKKKRRRVILFAHGNAVDLAQQLPFLRDLSAALARGGAPVAIACFDYQGYGESRAVSEGEGDDDGDGIGGPGGRGACTCGSSSTSTSSRANAAGASTPPPRQVPCPDHGAAADSTTADALLDGAAALRWLLEEKGFEASEVVLYGQSLGSGVATSLAVALCERERRRAREEEKEMRSKGRKGAAVAAAAAAAAAATTTTTAASSSNSLAAAGLILHSPLASGLRVLKPSGRWWPAALDIFPVARAAAKLVSPKTKCLVIHGDADDVVPFDNGRAVFDALPAEARVEPLWVKGGSHCDLEGHAGFLPRLLKFLKEEIS